MKKKFIEIEISIKHALNETLQAIEILENKSNKRLCKILKVF